MFYIFIKVYKYLFILNNYAIFISKLKFIF